MISEDDLIQIAEDICLSLFAEGVAVPDADGLTSVDNDGPTRTLTAVVDISGDWNGCVSVSCERTTAMGIASAMFAAPAAELSRNDIVDALGELANMTGGAIKGMLDGEKTLGLPTVGEGVDMIMSVPHTAELAVTDYKVGDGGIVRLAVHQVVGSARTA